MQRTIAIRMVMVWFLGMTVLFMDSSARAIDEYALGNDTSTISGADYTSSPSESQVRLSAVLLDPEKNSRRRAATVQVQVTGINLIDPAEVGERPRMGEGHIHYQLDRGPVIATTSTKLGFHELSSGSHQLTVMLAGNDHRPLGPQQTLNFTIQNVGIQ